MENESVFMDTASSLSDNEGTLTTGSTEDAVCSALTNLTVKGDVRQDGGIRRLLGKVKLKFYFLIK